MSMLNVNRNVNDLCLDTQLSIFQFSVEGGDSIQTPIQTVRNISLVCEQWKDLTYKNLLPLYWNRLNAFIKALTPYQNGIELLANASVDCKWLSSFERLSKALGSSSLMLLPCEYERFIDCQLEKMWIRIRNEFGFESDNRPKSASEIRAWLKDPNNIPSIQTVTVLYLSGLQLTHLPPEIAYFTNLEELYLYNNELKALPAEIGRLVNLRMLNLDDNQLTALPAEIGRLVNLRMLNLEHNQLAALPAEIGRLVNL